MSQIQNNHEESYQNNQKRHGRRKKQSLVMRILKIWLTCLLIAFVALGALAVKKVGIPVISMYQEARQLVAESDENTFKSEQTSIVYDVGGNEIKKLKGEKDVYYLSYENLPDAAKLAIISIEDKNFTSHRGIDLEGIARSVLSLIRNRGQITMGGSTITQQLARNIFLNYEVTYSRKVEEMFVAIELEKKYTKQQILEYYLNNVYFSNGYYGIEAASEAYFNKEAKDLTISQIAFLCAIPNSPTHYDPYEHPDSTIARRDKILKNMYEDEYISKEQYEQSLAEKIEVEPKKETTTNDYAETYILKCATEALMQEQGFVLQSTFSSESEKERYNESYDELYSSCKKSLYSAGYRIYTSIDMDIQDELQSSVSTELSMFTDKTDDGIYKVQGAAVCIDNDTGRVSAIVGGREEDQEGYGLNRAYQSFRQPGSAIKPLLVYAPALEQGYTPTSTLDDSRMSGEDTVSNSGYSYLGSISLRKAVQKSSNVATYRLYQELGPEKCMKYLEDMNFKGLEDADYKYDTTCLGGFTTGVTGIEMAAAYATLANDGEYRYPSCIVEITDAGGTVVVADEQEEKEVYSSNAARMMTDVLESCVTDSTATASGCSLDVDMPAACKTGTTTDYVDGWLCGYTPYYTTAVWVGMDVYQSVEDLKGNTYPAYIWKSFMEKAHQDLPRKEFETYLGEEEDDYSYQSTATTQAKEEEELDLDMGTADTEEEPTATTQESANQNTEAEEDNGYGNDGSSNSGGGDAGGNAGAGTTEESSGVTGGSTEGTETFGGGDTGGAAGPGIGGAE